MSIFEDAPMDWPPGAQAKELQKPDTRMVRCVMNGYSKCAAKTPEACACGKLSAAEYETAYQRKYGGGRSIGWPGAMLGMDGKFY